MQGQMIHFSVKILQLLWMIHYSRPSGPSDTREGQPTHLVTKQSTWLPLHGMLDPFVSQTVSSHLAVQPVSLPGIWW